MAGLLTLGVMRDMKLGLFSPNERIADVEFAYAELSARDDDVGYWSNFHPPLALRLLRREFE
jgi:hypothetical protein